MYRVTTLMPYEQVLQNINQVQEQILQNQTEEATGKSLTAPSSDPAAYSEDLVVRAQLGQMTTYANVAANASEVAQATSQAMSDVLSAAQSAYSVGIQANSPQSAASLGAMAAQLQQTLASIGQLANTQVGDIYVFGGMSGVQPWQATNPAVLAAAAPMQVAVAPGETASQNVDGSSTVGGILSAVNALYQAVQGLQAGTAGAQAQLDTAMTSLQSSMEALTAQQAAFGAQMQRIQAAQAFDAEQQTSLTATKAQLQDASLPDVVSQLATEETAYQGILQTAASVLLPTLAKYLPGG